MLALWKQTEYVCGPRVKYGFSKIFLERRKTKGRSSEEERLDLLLQLSVQLMIKTSGCQVLCPFTLKALVESVHLGTECGFHLRGLSSRSPVCMNDDTVPD